jgi:hypothetical protein
MLEEIFKKDDINEILSVLDTEKGQIEEMIVVYSHKSEGLVFRCTTDKQHIQVGMLEFSKQYILKNIGEDASA